MATYSPSFWCVTAFIVRCAGTPSRPTHASRSYGGYCRATSEARAFNCPPFRHCSHGVMKNIRVTRAPPPPRLKRSPHCFTRHPIKKKGKGSLSPLVTVHEGGLADRVTSAGHFISNGMPSIIVDPRLNCKERRRKVERERNA